MHTPILPRLHWPSNRSGKLLASPTTPLNQLRAGVPFRRFVRSLSLRPSWLLAPCADPTKMVPCLTRPSRAFTSGLPVPEELPDMTTAPHGNLRRRDFHPQVQQLASLRRFRGTIKALRPPAVPPAALRCLRLAVPRERTALFVPPDAAARQTSGLGLVTRYPRPGLLPWKRQDLSSFWGAPISVCTCSWTPDGLYAPDHYGALTWPPSTKTGRRRRSAKFRGWI